ncbi:MAG: hypothetical protein WCW31_04280 [Patescibacteria group bacterium]|jgi:hypothetical protein
MKIELVLSHKQLDGLSRMLESKDNIYPGLDGSTAYYARVIQAGTMEVGPNDNRCVPKYHVTLSVDETYCVRRSGGAVTFRTPLAILAKLLKAVNLFPKKNDVLDK